MDETILTHNGFITLSNPSTGGHSTLRIKTQRPGTWREGSRLVGLLTGSDNVKDYTNFGEVTEKGTVKVWGKFRSDNGQPSKHEVYGRMLENPEHYQDRGIEYQFDTRCRVCNRVLTHPASITTGIGPTCAQNTGISQAEYYTNENPETGRATEANTELRRTRALENQEEQHARGRDQKIYKASKRKMRKILDSLDKLYDSKRLLVNDWLSFTYTVPVDYDDYQPFDDALTAFEDWFKFYLEDDYSYFVEPDIATFSYGYVAIGIRHSADKGLLYFSGSWTE